MEQEVGVLSTVVRRKQPLDQVRAVRFVLNLYITGKVAARQNKAVATTEKINIVTDVESIDGQICSRREMQNIR